jgi:hypothetical protein
MITDIRWNFFSGIGRSLLWFDETAENSARTAGHLLFFFGRTGGDAGFLRDTGCRWLIICFRKQQKQPVNAMRLWHRRLGICVL